MTYNPNARGVPAISRAAARAGQNQTGFNILKGTPVRVTSTGIAKIDPSTESNIDGLAGVVKDDIANGFQGEIISAGLIENITTSYSPGDIIYIAKDGSLTNSKPQIGVAGFLESDFIVKIGVIAKNNDNPLLKDLIVTMQIIGQLWQEGYMAKKKMQVKDLSKMSVSEKVKYAEDLGAQVAEIINEALEKANKMLAPHGYLVNVRADFSEIPKDEEKQ